VSSDTYRRIYAVVRKIPQGRVATYGQVARLAGLPRHARLVGYALHALNDQYAEGRRVPWQRVVNARGEISPRVWTGAEDVQREALEDEGIEFDRRGRIRLATYQWKRGRHG
jgi:methylated-DNA-protein-cysteine methyltransferase-like protein